VQLKPERSETDLNEGSATRRSPSVVRFSPPGDFSVSMRATRAGVQGQRRQPMRGYEDTYVDIVDYIVRITDRIWEDQDVGYIYDTYRAACRIHYDSGLRYGVEGVVEDTIQSINSFPDTRHYADDVIWAGNEDEGFATSHRALNVGRHLGPWRWGPATGRKINMWVIANCVSEQNEIYEEWVLYNTAARLVQCGVDVRSAARAYGNAKHALPLGEREVSEVERGIGGRKPEPYRHARGGGGFDVEDVVLGLFHDTYNRRDLSAIDRAYSRNVRWHGTTNREGYGRADVRGMARALLATFPDLGLQVDELYWMGNEQEGFAAAVRWTALGSHRGYGLYGEPTGRRVHIWGLSQLYFRGGEIVEDWSLFNEFDVLAQLLRDEPLPLTPDRA
jgi:predicted ester cyclase